MRIQQSYNQRFIDPYSFQAQEHDDEVKGDGNSVNYKYRMHDPRLGRFFAIDPLTKSYPHYTPYSFSGNKVIAWSELEGLEEFIAYKTVDGYRIIWDISARNRDGGKQRATIIYLNADGTIFENMRKLNQNELDNPNIYLRTTIPSDSPSIDSRNPEQTYLKNENGDWSGEIIVPLNFGVPEVPDTDSKSSAEDKKDIPAKKPLIMQ